MMEDSLYEHFYELIREIPKGKVSTYGDIAFMADCRSARAVGFALNRLPDNSGIPWQRVINSQGKEAVWEPKVIAESIHVSGSRRASRKKKKMANDNYSS